MMTDSVPGPDRQKKGWLRGCAAVLVASLIGLAFVAIVGGTVWQMLFKAENPVAPGQQLEFEVKHGESFTQIADALAKDGVVRNALMFKLRARNAPETTKLKPGTYAFVTGMPYDIVLKKLAAGPDIVYYDVTIPEGFTARRVAARFAKETGVSELIFLELVLHGAPKYATNHPYLKNAYGGSLEGYLFPKTYHIREGTSANDIIELMLDQFDKEIANVDLTAAEARGYDINEVVTIASIIERETRLAREYPLVSSVIQNRLALPMRLQLDSTVFYGLPEGTKVLHPGDIQAVTPWNTYRRDGLPLTPICNPGIKAIEAAAHPTSTKFLYYVLTSKDGSQTFTTNYPDFLKAVKKYRKLFGY